MTKVKICGLTKERDIEAINAYRPEYIGFVFYKKSRRYIEPEDALLLKQKITANVQTVGVFVDAPIKQIVQLVNRKIIDVVQLHGKEEDGYVTELKKFITVPIIQAFQIAAPEDVQRANTSKAEYILLDSGTGTGRTFDWSVLSLVERPYFLAGGLTPANVRMAIDTVKPYGVDTSSGVETDGVKDPLKIEQFMKEVQDR